MGNVEYYTINLNTYEDIDGVLNRYATKGWRLITVDNKIAYLERQYIQTGISKFTMDGRLII